MSLCEASEFSDIRWQANERDTFRDINKDPFIMYPVEGNVATVPHKVSLLIQIELGRVELTNINNFERQRLRGESLRVLEVMHRLIRAVIECKGSDSDGPGCWAALELARSLTAKAWEGRPMQLLQVPQVGPVLMRKLVAHNIRTVHQLADSDPGNIERIASRNPPFGKKLKDSVALFPRLTLATTVKDCKVERDGKPMVHVDALLGFSSTRGKWMSKVPIVTFLAVTSEGASAHFSRESLSSFNQEAQNSHQVRFTWMPSTFGETLICRFACEEIVGTVMSTELRHKFPASTFLHLPKKIQPLSNKSQGTAPDRTSAASPTFKDTVDDADIEGLLNDLSRPSSNTHNDIEAGVDDDDLFTMIDRDGNFEERPPKPAHVPPKNSMDIADRIMAEIDDDDLFAMVDGDGGFECKPMLSTQALRKNKAGAIGGESYEKSGSSMPASRAVHQVAGIDTNPPQSRKTQEKNNGIHIVDESIVQENAVRLPNGRYKCGHSCSQIEGGTTARGVRCGHDCCRNGSKHPPKKNTSNGKRKDHIGGPDISESEPVPDFSLADPPRKRARVLNASNNKNSSSTSSSIAPFTETRFSPITPKLDLSLYNVDEDGLIDLTEADEPVADLVQPSWTRSTSGAAKSGQKRGTASTIEMSTDDLLDDVSDTDIVDFDKLMNTQRGSQPRNAYVPQKSNETVTDAYSKKITSSGVRDDARGTINQSSLSELERSIKPATKLRRTSRPLLSSATPAAPKQANAIGLETVHHEVPEWVSVEDSPPLATELKGETEPGWVKEFDEDFISEFRGLVDFT